MNNIIYSPSRIDTFDSCKLKYKHQYIDKLEKASKGIEAFRGSMAHEALEEFYKLVKNGSIKSLEWLLAKYKEVWNKNYTDNIRIVRKELRAEDYFNKGRQALIDYYERYKPFDQTKIVDTERMISFTVRHKGSEYAFHGIMDRLDWNDKASMFEIHDYKVASKLMTQEDADTDWQLGLYHIGLKEKWPDIRKVKLVWHSLLFNKEMVSYRTKEQLEELQKEVGERVKEIESCKDFPPEKSSLCDWCDYQNICPLWKHPKEMEELPVDEYKKDPGVKLVSKYAEFEEKKNELKEEIHEIDQEQKKISEAVIEFAEKNKISIIDGPNNQLKVDIKDELKAPSKTENQDAWKKLRDFLIKEKKFTEVSTVSGGMLRYQLRKKLWPAEFMEKVKKFLKRQITKKVKLVKKKQIDQ